MTLDLAQLRRLAEESRAASTQLRNYPDVPTFDAVHEAEVRLYAALPPEVVLAVLDRLERAERKLAERDAVYPTLMTQVGKEKK